MDAQRGVFWKSNSVNRWLVNLSKFFASTSCRWRWMATDISAPVDRSMRLGTMRPKMRSAQFRWINSSTERSILHAKSLCVYMALVCHLTGFCKFNLFILYVYFSLIFSFPYPPPWGGKVLVFPVVIFLISNHNIFAWMNHVRVESIARTFGSTVIWNYLACMKSPHVQRSSSQKRILVTFVEQCLCCTILWWCQS